MAIRLDLSPSSVVVYCSDCPWWADVTTTRMSAHTAAGGHEAQCHPGERTAQDNRDQYRDRHTARHADKTQNEGI